MNKDIRTVAFWTEPGQSDRKGEAVSEKLDTAAKGTAARLSQRSVAITVLRYHPGLFPEDILFLSRLASQRHANRKLSRAETWTLAYLMGQAEMACRETVSFEDFVAFGEHGE